jgi:hypothetical membrane protein
MWNRRLLACGTAMPAIYGLTLAVSCSLNSGFGLLHHEPSELGCTGAVYPFIYDAGMVATAVAGVLAAVALVIAPGSGRGSAWNICAGTTILLASVGLAMAGLFPLPNPLHYGFGLTTVAILTPVFGAVSLRGSGSRWASALLLAALALIAGLVAEGAPPVVPGAVMLGAIAGLCWIIRDRKKIPAS